MYAAGLGSTIIYAICDFFFLNLVFPFLSRKPVR
jgi:hypothetical protein